MGTLLAFPLSMPLGGCQVTNIRMDPVGSDQWIVEWTPISFGWDSSYQIYVDGELFDVKTGQTSMILDGEPGATPIVEVIQMPAGWGDPGFARPELLDATLLDNKINFTWTPPASVVDVVKYRVYWDNATGTVDFSEPLEEVEEDGSSSYEIWTDQIAAGTYKFVVRTVDAAGNESTNVAETSVVLSTYADVVSGLSASFSGGMVTLTWTDPADIGAGNVRVYDNSGSTTNLYPDYESIVATIPAGTETWTSGALGDGIWVFGLRVYNGTAEELNTNIVATVRIESGSEVAGYPTKPVLEAENAPGGTVILTCAVENPKQFTTPVKAQFFTNDGAGGAVDYGTPLGAGFITLDITGDDHTATLTTVAYGETARKFGLRVYAEDDTPSVDADEVEITPDATPPPDPLTPAGSTGRQ